MCEYGRTAYMYACQHVAVLYSQHDLSMVTCFLGGGGIVVAKRTGLMNMLEAQNTLVSILYILPC